MPRQPPHSAQKSRNMKAPAAYAAGVIAAAALPVSLLVVVAMLSGNFPSRFVLGTLVWRATLVFAIAAAVAIPTLLLLHMLRAVRWLWLGVAGYLAGFVLYGAYLISSRVDPFALQMTSIGLLGASMVGGAIGWVCASVCWFTIDYLMRSGDSQEQS